MMHLVAPFGFYGWGNIGDEATLNGFALLLGRDGGGARVSVGSRDPAHTARVEPAFRYFRASGRDPRRWLAKLRASAHAVVGGTPITDVLGEWPLCDVAPLVRAIDRWKVPMAFIGVGIEDLRLSESRRVVSEEIIPRVRHWSVRSERDQLRLLDLGARRDMITVAADMAWLIDAVTPEFGRERLRRAGIDPREPLIGVNVVNENRVFDRQPRIAEALAAALDELVADSEARVVFLANEVRDEPSFDRAAAKQVIGRMRRGDRAVLMANDYLSPREMMSIVACCALTMSMRYHFCLFSAVQGVPFIAIERADKIRDLCADLRWPARLALLEFDGTEIVGHGRQLRRDAGALGGELKQRVQDMRRRASHNVAALDALRASSADGSVRPRMAG